MLDTPLSLAEPARARPNWVLERGAVQPPPAAPLDPAQQAVVDHRAGALLVLAGPGTGKTHTLTEAVVARLAAGMTADQVLVLTFARKAAAEIRDRIVTRRGGGQLPTVCTFHSLALGIVREFGGEQFAQLRLLTAPEQEVIVQEVLRTLIREQRAAEEVRWPVELAGALQTRGLAVEVRNALARARALGLAPDQVQAAAGQSGLAGWDAIGRLLEVYLDVAAQQQLLDYNELILAALELVKQPLVGAELQRRYRAIFVDEYQDTDPLQIQLLQHIAAADGLLIAVGDPDQSIYGFRGADPGSVKRFATDFAHMNSAAPPAATALTVNRRASAELRAAASRVISRAGAQLLPSELVGSHRELLTPTEIAAGPAPTFTSYESAEVEAAEVAEQIRRIVLSPNHEYRWSDVAVLVRSGTRSIPILQRALQQADVPVVTVYDDLPLASEPAVRTLLLALRCVGDPMLITAEHNAHELLSSELAWLDPAELRRLSRLVRDDCPGFSEIRIAEALADPRVGAGIPPEAGGDAWRRLVGLRDLLAATHAQFRRGATVHELLWALWSGTDWPQRLRSRALGEGVTAAAANHDLDVVITLMELASASSYRAAIGGQLDNFVNTVRDLLVPEQPASPALSPNAVSLLTAHRAKGLEWPVVFVCSADEQTWPDLRRRNSLFEPDRLRVIEAASGPTAELGGIPERQEVVAEERRLFYVACTRAKRELHVSSTGADREAGRARSRFVNQLIELPESNGDESAEANFDIELADRPRYSPNALVAQLRRLGSAPGVTPDQRSAAARRLARLAKLTDHRDRIAIPAADPRAWWGVAQATSNDAPIEPADEPVYVRGSSLQELQSCSFRWFLSQRVHAEEPKGLALVFGSVIHAFADAVIRGEVPASHPEIVERLAALFPKVRYEADWQAAAELQEAGDCIARFLLWLGSRPQEVVETHSEVEFVGDWALTLPDGTNDRMRLRGKIDVVELQHSGGVYIVDFKTSSTYPSKGDAAVNPQLGLYQTAANQGLLNSVVTPQSQVSLPLNPIGAELVFLRKNAGEHNPAPLIRTQPVVAEWFEELAAAAVATVRTEDYSPTAGTHCSDCSFSSLCPIYAEGKPVLP